jgi:hypothetical protein
MTIDLKVEAQVIDIVSDRPHRSDIFLVDTNVWIWQTYPNAKNSSKIQDFAVPLNELIIDESTTNAALARFQTQALDGYDLFILEAIHKANPGQVKVITDDMDYATVQNIQLFTSNIQVIKLAKAQGKLLRR